jgi:hypothetical protein
MHLFNFDTRKKQNADTESESTRSRLAGMRSHSENKKAEGGSNPAEGNSNLMDRVRGSHTESLSTQRRTSKDSWFLRQSETHRRLDQSLDTGALAHLEPPQWENWED